MHEYDEIYGTYFSQYQLYEITTVIQYYFQIRIIHIQTTFRHNNIVQIECFWKPSKEYE